MDTLSTAVKVILLMLVSGVSLQFVNIQEPAIIVVYSESLTNLSDFENTTKLSLVCVAYGEPPPTVTWFSHDQRVDNFYSNTSSERSTLNIFNIFVNDTQFNYVTSVLELCDVINSSVLDSFTCVASNGRTTDRPIGLQSVIFFGSEITTTTMVPNATFTVRIAATSDVTITTTDLSSVTMTTIVAVTVFGCVFVLSLAIIVSTVIAVLAWRSNHPAEQAPPSLTFDPEYRVYRNSLYGENIEGQQKTKRSETLIDCAAYDSQPISYEYDYVAPPTGLKTQNNADRTEDVSLQPCAAYNVHVTTQACEPTEHVNVHPYEESNF